MKLYFVALIPPKGLEQEVHCIKQEMADKYNTRKALKLPAHITLDAPFKYKEEKEQEIFNALEAYAAKQTAFDVTLKDFGAFPPRTIFLKVKNPEPVVEAFHSLQKCLQENLHRKQKEKENSINPHMTVAFRDLEKESFKAAWEEFKNREFSAEFKAQSVFLLKHNGKTWDVYRNFPF